MLLAMLVEEHKEVMRLRERLDRLTFELSWKDDEGEES
jgi:hypothetical protein